MPPCHSLRKATTKLGRFGMQIVPTAKGSSSLPTFLHLLLLLLLLLVIRPLKVVADDGKKLITPPSSGAAPQLLSEAHLRAGEHSHSGNHHPTPPNPTAAPQLPHAPPNSAAEDSSADRRCTSSLTNNKHGPGIRRDRQVLTDFSYYIRTCLHMHTQGKSTEITSDYFMLLLLCRP